jgi:hypothetical protein
MPLDYGTTDRLRAAIAAMRQHAVDDKVGLVMRWNKRDDMIWTLYSEFKDKPDPKNIRPEQRAIFKRLIGDGGGDNEQFRDAPSTALIGCHAEEILVVNWKHFELQAVGIILAQAMGKWEPAPWARVPLKTEKFKLREVDLVLSKSPCHGPGGSQALQVGVHQYGTGCAMKLVRFCGLPQFSDVTWRIFYCALPPEKFKTRYEWTKPEHVKEKLWKQQAGQREKDVNKNFTATRAPDSVEEQYWHAREGVAGALSPFADKLKLSLEAIGRLNQLPNVTCEPLQP